MNAPSYDREKKQNIWTHENSKQNLRNYLKAWENEITVRYKKKDNINVNIIGTAFSFQTKSPQEL